MNSGRKTELIQMVIVVLFLAGAVWLAIHQTLPPAVVPDSAPATGFSGERALIHIEAIAQEPRLVGTPAFEGARDYVLAELAAMGLAPEVQSTVSRGLDYGSVLYSRVENIVVRIPGSGGEDAIVLTAHLDSEAFSPGANDDGAGVAVLLEVARALQAGPPLRNAVILLFTGPEETGHQGAVAFVTQHRWAADVRLVIGLDAGGLKGPALLTGTSPDNGWLIREWARADPHALGNSAVQAFAYASTDFQVFRAAGISGFSFDYSWDRRTHTPLDSIDHVNARGVQHLGFHTLDLVRHFGDLELQDPREPTPVYFDVLSLVLVHYSQAWAIAFAVLVTLLFGGVLALGFRRGILTRSGMAWSALAFLLGVAMAALAVRLLWTLISSSVPLHRYVHVGHAYNEVLLGTAFLCLAIAFPSAGFLLLRRFKAVGWPDLSMGPLALFWVAMLGTTIVFPAVSYLFTWPLLFSVLATGVWFLSLRAERQDFTPVQLLLLLISAIAGITLYVPLVLISQMGNATADAFVAAGLLAVLVGALVPQLRVVSRPWRWGLPLLAGVVALGALGLAILDDHDANQPEPATVFYLLDADAGRAYWAAGLPGGGGLDEWSAQFFPPDARPRTEPLPGWRLPFGNPSFVENAPDLELPAPQAELLEESVSKGVRTVHLHLSSPRKAPYLLVAPADPNVEALSLEVEGVSSAPFFGGEARTRPGMLFLFNRLPSEGIDVILQVGASESIELVLVDSSWGLPQISGMTIEPMSDAVMPGVTASSYAYQTVVLRSVSLGP